MKNRFLTYMNFALNMKCLFKTFSLRSSCPSFFMPATARITRRASKDDPSHSLERMKYRFLTLFQFCIKNGRFVQKNSLRGSPASFMLATARINRRASMNDSSAVDTIIIRVEQIESDLVSVSRRLDTVQTTCWTAAMAVCSGCTVPCYSPWRMDGRSRWTKKRPRPKTGASCCASETELLYWLFSCPFSDLKFFGTACIWKGMAESVRGIACHNVHS